MPLNLTSAHSSRITKSRSKPSLRPSLSRGGFGSPRRQSTRPSESVSADAEERYSAERLPDAGIVVELAPEVSFVDVVQVIRYVQSIMFSHVPERSSGLNSTRISETLNFRVSLPPIVTLAHVNALLNAPCTIEREVTRLRRDGVVRQVVVPGRGSGGAGTAEGLVLFEDWQRLINDSYGLQDDVKSVFSRFILIHFRQLMLSRQISQITS